MRQTAVFDTTCTDAVLIKDRKLPVLIRKPDITVQFLPHFPSVGFIFDCFFAKMITRSHLIYKDRFSFRIFLINIACARSENKKSISRFTFFDHKLIFFVFSILYRMLSITVSPLLDILLAVEMSKWSATRPVAILAILAIS